MLNVHAQGLPLIRNFTAEEYGGHNRNFDIEMGENGTVFVANFEGLLYYDRAQWHTLHSPDLARVTVVYRDRRNTVWVGGYKYFARVEKQANGELYLETVGKKDQFKGEVVEIFEDGGAVQFLASDNIIYEVHGDAFAAKKSVQAEIRPGIDAELISVEALKAGEKNIVMEDITQTEELDGGLAVKVKKDHGLIITDANGRELYVINEQNGLCSNQVAYVAYDGHGLLWGVTLHGIFCVELPSVYSYLLSKDGLTGEVQVITSYGGKTYVGTTSGLYVIAARKCSRVNAIGNICWGLAVSRHGLLAATSSGIYRISPNGSVARLTSNATTALLVDNDDIYAAEPDGVYLYRDDTAVKKVNSLPHVMTMMKHVNGGMWFKNVAGEELGVNPGHVRQPIDNLSARLLKPVSHIDIKAQYMTYNQVWIGGDEVLAVINTDRRDLETLTDGSNVRFRSIILGGDSVLWGGYSDISDVTFKLSSKERHLHFYYAVDYSMLSGHTLYRYRLNDGKWSPWSEKQDVEFLNLPYGSYTLAIQAQLPNGVVTKETAVSFRIAYPLLMRWYMVMLYFAMFVVLMFALFRYRLKRLERDKMKLERIVEERTADLRNAQHELVRQEKMASVGKLTEGLIDRILNPMNYIINFSKMSNDLLKDLKVNIENNRNRMDEADYEDTADVLDMLTENLQNVDQYGQNTTRTLKAMEEMLKDRTGGYVDMDLIPVLQQNREMTGNYYAREIQHYGIKMSYSWPDSPLMLHGNPDMLSKTVMSLIGNAVYAVGKAAEKRTPYQPEVALTVTRQDTAYRITIHDNGTGIEEKVMGKIFDPFFTTKPTSEGAGVGLYLSREIIQNHGGDITVRSVKDQFTEFTIMLPALKGQTHGTTD